MILSRFRKYLLENCGVRSGERILIALSGGGDSTALLHLFLELRDERGFKIAVAHYNHRLRGKSSMDDEAFVRSLASRHDLPFSCGAASSDRSAPPPGRSLQEGAREERLSYLLLTAGRRRCSRIALGHTADDQAETMIMRFIGGAGPPGLGGIPDASHDGRIIHPLLGIRKEEAEAWLRSRKIPFRRDPSNRRKIYLRNRLRLELVPLLLKDYNPRLVERLCDLSSQFRIDDDFLDSAARDVMAKGRFRGRSVFFPSELLSSTHRALLARVLLASVRLISPGGKEFGSRHINTLIDGIGKSRALEWDLPDGLTATWDRRGMTIAGKSKRIIREGFTMTFPVPGSAALPGNLGTMGAAVRAKTDSFDPRSSRCGGLRACVDWDRVRPPFTMRSRLPGDRYRPLGLKGEKKIQDLFIDARVPRPERDRIPLLCDSEGIIWVAGFAPAARCRVRAATKKILFLRFRPSA